MKQKLLILIVSASLLLLSACNELGTRSRQTAALATAYAPKPVPPASTPQPPAALSPDGFMTFTPAPALAPMPEGGCK